MKGRVKPTKKDESMYKEHRHLTVLLRQDRAPDTHTHTQIPRKKMDLPASCGLAETSEPDRR